MMGHANEAVTQSVYSHEIQRRESRERTQAGMRKAFARADERIRYPEELLSTRERRG